MLVLVLEPGSLLQTARPGPFFLLRVMSCAPACKPKLAQKYPEVAQQQPHCVRGKISPQILFLGVSALRLKDAGCNNGHQ